MKVRVLYPSAFVAWGHDPGDKDVVEVPDDVAATLIESGYAEAESPAKREPVQKAAEKAG